MVLLHYGIKKKPAIGFMGLPVAAFWRPACADVPVPAKDRIGIRPLKAWSLEPGNGCQFFEIVGPGFVDDFLVRKFVAPGLLCNAGFQCALQSIPRKIIGSAELPRAEEDPRLSESNVCQRLQLSSIHHDDCRVDEEAVEGGRLHPIDGGNGSRLPLLPALENQ